MFAVYGMSGAEYHDEFSYSPPVTILIDDPEVYNFAKAEEVAQDFLWWASWDEDNACCRILSIEFVA